VLHSLFVLNPFRSFSFIYYIIDFGNMFLLLVLCHLDELWPNVKFYFFFVNRSVEMSIFFTRNAFSCERRKFLVESVGLYYKIIKKETWDQNKLG